MKSSRSGMAASRWALAMAMWNLFPTRRASNSCLRPRRKRPTNDLCGDGDVAFGAFVVKTGIMPGDRAGFPLDRPFEFVRGQGPALGVFGQPQISMGIGDVQTKRAVPELSQIFHYPALAEPLREGLDAGRVD